MTPRDQEIMMDAQAFFPKNSTFIGFTPHFKKGMSVQALDTAPPKSFVAGKWYTITNVQHYITRKYSNWQDTTVLKGALKTARAMSVLGNEIRPMILKPVQTFSLLPLR